jgi:hypothetical protein
VLESEHFILSRLVPEAASGTGHLRPEVEPESPLRLVLASARDRARANEAAQVDRVSRSLARESGEVVRSLENLVDRVEVRVTRSLAVAHHLLDELSAGRIPTIRSVFETGRQDHTSNPGRIAGVVRFRAGQEPAIFGPEAAALAEDDRPKYGFAFFEGTPNAPYPFGPVCFLLTLDSADLRERITFTPVDSSIPGLDPDEVGTLDHPVNAFARSSDAGRAAGLLSVEGTIPLGSGIRDNAREGTPEAQIWGPLLVIPSQVLAIMVEVFGGPSPELDSLRTVAERQGVPLHVRVLERGNP